jgi:hypothetical protein
MLNFGKISDYKYFVIAAIIFSITICISIFETQILSFYWRLKCPSPVVWKNVKIHLDKDMIYKIDDKKIYFTYWKGPTEGVLSISNLHTSNPSKMVDILSKQDRIVMDTYYKYLQEFNSYYIKYKKKNEKDIKIATYIIPLSLLLLYEGPYEKYQYFESVINKMEFLNTFGSPENNNQAKEALQGLWGRSYNLTFLLVP